MKKTILILSGVLLLTGVPAAMYLTGFIQFGGTAEAATAEDDGHGGGDAHEDEAAPPAYLALDPPFVVNFLHQGTLRYLQVSLEVMYRNQDLLSRVETRMPAIRNDLIMLFSGQEFEQLNSQAGKQALRKQIREAINAQIHVAGEEQGRGEVYITNFVMQ